MLMYVSLSTPVRSGIYWHKYSGSTAILLRQLCAGMGLPAPPSSLDVIVLHRRSGEILKSGSVWGM